MSRRWWSADFHANHANICIYCKRPWLKAADLTPDGKWISREAAVACALRMNAGILAAVNMRVKPDDRAVHIGDFATAGKAAGVEGTGDTAQDFLAKLNGTWTLLEGNHDKQGKVKTVGKHLFGSMGNYRFFASHLPTEGDNHDPLLVDYVRRTCHFVLCGHVHDSWRTKDCEGIFNINVGLDANDYLPISDDEILVLYQQGAKR